MLKTVTPLLIADTATKKALLLLDTYLEEPDAADPDATQWSRAGFSQPDYFGASPVFVSADTTRAFNVQVRERVLPGKVIRTKVLERATELAERQGHKVGRKQLAEIKDEVVASLLPTAFIKPVDVLCVITKEYLLIGTGSAKLVDLVVDMLRKVCSEHGTSLQFQHATYGRSDAGKWMLELLLEGTTDSGLFNVGESVALRGEDKSTARFKDMDLHSERIHEHVATGMTPVEIAVEYDGRLTFSLSDQLLIKRIRFSDILLKEAAEEGESVVERFDSTLALVSGELRTMLDSLMAEIPLNGDEDDEL